MMKKLGLLMVSMLIIFSLVACGEEKPENDEQNYEMEQFDWEKYKEENISNEVEINEDFEEVVLESGEGYTISVVDMKHEDEKYIIYIAVDNQTEIEMNFDILSVAINNLMLRDYDWYERKFPAGEKTIRKLVMSEGHLNYLGITEGILKVDMYTVMKIEDVDYGYMTYYPNGEGAAENITTGSQIDGTVVFENEYYKIGYDGYLDSGFDMMGDTLLLTVQNKTDKLVELNNATVFFINDSDDTASSVHKGYLFPNGTYDIQISFFDLKLEEGMKLKADFHLTDNEIEEVLCEDTITIIIE